MGLQRRKCHEKKNHLDSRGGMCRIALRLFPGRKTAGLDGLFHIRFQCGQFHARTRPEPTGIGQLPFFFGG